MNKILDISNDKLAPCKMIAGIMGYNISDVESMIEKIRKGFREKTDNIYPEIIHKN